MAVAEFEFGLQVHRQPTLKRAPRDAFRIGRCARCALDQLLDQRQADAQPVLGTLRMLHLGLAEHVEDRAGSRR